MYINCFPELKKFNNHICCSYESSKHLVERDSWLTCPPTQFVNLLLIHHLKEHSTKEQLDKVAKLMRENIPSSKLNQSYTTKNVEDIFKGTDGSITKSNIILIEGVPGIGKTILCKEIAYRWARKELLKDDSIVLLLFLRDPIIQNIKSVKDIVWYMYRYRYDYEVIKISNACATHIMDTEGANVTIILDGFDELSHAKSKNEFISDLLYKTILPLCRIVVSSRPVASNDLKKIADVKVEILGFNEESRQTFIKNELKDHSDKLTRLNSYLKENVIIDHLCYIPFMLSVLVYVAKECQELPKSRTELYHKFIIHTISRFLQRLNPPMSAISNLDKLPSKFENYFLAICKYAYVALQCDKIIFTANEIKNDFPTFANAPDSWSGLGLLKSANYFSVEENSDCTSYNFLHLSIQEYLAAYYITTVNTNKQINILRKYFFVDKYLNMWIMYVGLSERPLALMHFLSGKNSLIFTRLFSIDKISEVIMQSKIKRLYLFQCLSEMKDSIILYDLVSTLFEKRVLDLSDYTMLSKDIDTLIYILDRSATTHWDELNLSHCNIGDHGYYQLCKAIDDFNHSVIFDKVNLSNNQLTIDSLEIIIDFVICCKTQVLCLSDNFNINYDAKLIYVAMEYAFKETHQKYPLTVQVHNQESVVFNELDKQTIVSHTKSRYWITGVCFINCKIDDEVVTVLSDISNTHKLLHQVCLWNSSISSTIVEDFLSILFQKQKECAQLLFVYEDSDCTFKFDSAKFPNFTFIYYNNFSLILHGVDDMHAKFIIFSNPMQLLKPEKLIEVQISNLKIDKDTVSKLSQLFSQCRLRKFVLLNNQINFQLLYQLITGVNFLSSLSEIVIEHDNMTTTECYTIAGDLSSSQTHSVMILYDKGLIGYRCHDKQLNEIDTDAAISTIISQLCKVNIIVYEKNLCTDDDSFIHDACKSKSVPYALLSKSILSIENVNNSYVISTLLKSLLFYASNLFKIVFTNCDLRSTNHKLVQLFPNVFSQCKFLIKFVSINNNLGCDIAKLLCNSLIEILSLREIIIYERNFTVRDILKLKDDLIKKKQTISFVIMTNNILLGHKCSDELFNWTINLNMMITTVWLVHCNINQFTFESMRKISDLKIITIRNSKFSQQLSDSVLSGNNKLEELYLGNNPLQLGVIKITTALKNISSLKVLGLDNNNIPEQVTDEFSAAIRANKCLEKLWLGGNCLGSSTVVVMNALKEISTLKELDLNDNKNRSEELASALASIITNNTLIERLTLRDNNLNDDGVIKIAQSLCKNSKLKLINIRSNDITEEAAEALASIISSNTGLEELYLGNNQIHSGAIKISTALKNISSLKVLDLENNNIPEGVVDELSAAITANDSLKKLLLSGNHLGSSTEMIINALNKVTTLEELTLNDNKNRGEELSQAMTSVLRKNKLIKKLMLCDNNLNDDGVKKIAQSLRKYSKLKVIHLQCNNITEQGAEALASIISSNTGLQELYLGNNQLQSGVIIIATALKSISSLKVLDLEINNIPEQVADELSAAIRTNVLLEKLWLSGNHLGSSTVKIINALNKVTTLKELTLNDNKNRSEELIPAITSVVTKNELMKRLMLCDNNLNDDGVIKIAQSLCKHSNLKFIDLQINKITKAAAEALASIISSNTGLEEVYLGNNQLQSGVIKIASALQNVSSLKVLDLKNNNISEQVADELAAAIKSNSSLEKLWLGGNHLGSSTVRIVNALKKISTLKELYLNDNKNRSEELAPALASIITKNKLMEIFSLSDNNLNDDGVIKIAPSLCKYSKLKVLDLQNNNISEEAAEALSSIISSNIGLEELYLGNNQLQSGVIKIATALKKFSSSLKSLELVNNNITEQVADELSAAIKANNLLEKLWLDDNYLGSSIAKACSHAFSLKEFSFKNIGISVEAANDIVGVIKCNSLLECLSMSDNNLQSSGFMVIAQALKVRSSLKFLYAYGINITSFASEELSSVIDHNMSLKEILLGDNLLENGLMQIVESCSILPNLKFLEISHNSISPTLVVNLASIVSKCNSLEALSLGGICLSVDEILYFNVYRKQLRKELSSNSTQEMLLNKLCFELMRMTNCQTSSRNYSGLMYQYWYVYISYQHKDKLEQTTWSDTDYNLIIQKATEKLSQIDSKAMISSLQIIRTLKAINLENNNIDEDASTELAGHLYCNNVLEQLWLRGNELYDKGASLVLQSLHNLSTLLILDLSFNHLSSESADGIAVVIGNNCSLQQLWLDGNDLLTRGIVIIASALKKLSSLRILSLCSNGITDDAAEEISNVINSNILLVDMLLGNNQLQTMGIYKIAIALRKCFIIRTLDLSNNHITPDAAEELAVTLSNCTNLQQLFLNDNTLGTEGTIKITNALKFINTLQVLTLSNNNITENAVDVLVDVLKNNISLKIVLIGKNDLQITGVNLIIQTAKNITTLQLLDVSDNNVSEDEKEDIKTNFVKNNNFIIIV